MIVVAASLAGSVGAVCRYLLSTWARERFGADFPLGTLMVNVAGSFGLGAAVGAGALDSPVALAMVGFFGGFTTFSTWVVEVIGLEPSGRRALLYVVLSLVGGVVAAAGGYALFA